MMTVTVDEDETDLDDVIADMDYDFTEPDCHSQIVTTEIKGYEVVNSRDDTILL